MIGSMSHSGTRTGPVRYGKKSIKTAHASNWETEVFALAWEQIEHQPIVAETLRFFLLCEGELAESWKGMM